MSNLALNLLVLNGENCLPRMLRSVGGIVDTYGVTGCPIDELVVTDTGSTDETFNILVTFAKERHLRFAFHSITPESHPELFFLDSPLVFSASWQPTNRYLLADWAKARNLALNDTTSDYILKLDADDELYEPLTLSQVESYTKYLEQHTTKDFISTPYDIMNGQYHAERQMYVRLWRNNPSIRWQQPIHEYLTNKHYANTFAYISDNRYLWTCDWRDSRGGGTRVPFRDLKTLEWHRLTHPEAMVDGSAAGILFRYTWAVAMVPVRPALARIELSSLGCLLPESEQGLLADVAYHIGRTYEGEGDIENAKSHYLKAAKMFFLDAHFPSLIQLVTMLDTAEYREHNSDLLKAVREKLALVPRGEIPIGCDLLAFGRITGRSCL
jgi:hypothetical protein